MYYMKIKNKVRKVYLDIENAPNLGFTWGKYEQDVIEFAKEWYIISFAYKFEGKSTQVRALPDYKTYSKDKTDDRELVAELWKVLDSADIIIGHNIDRFDIRKINARFLYHGLPLPSSYKTVDTLKVARKMFLLNSNKLDHVAKLLKIGTKVDTGGFSLWVQCMAGVKSAWSQMKKYNKHDVDLTETVYKKFRPFIANHPNENIYNGTTNHCPSCHSNHLQARGYAITSVGKYQRYQCQDCASWSQGERIKQDKVTIK